MKNIVSLLIALVALVTISCSNTEGMKTETFTVYGNCGMCKKTIEKSLDGVKGISSADWDMNTDKMTVTHDPKIISLEKIHKKIAGVGYDTDLERAPDSVYEKLHSCCQYERNDSEKE